MVKHNDFAFEVLVHGKRIREYRDNKTGKTFVEGRNGSNFTLCLRNFSSKRFLAVITVDGKDILTGNQGDWNAGGYIIPAYGKIEIPGWRLNSDSVAKFMFTNKQDSYSNQSGDGVQNCGVIACALFAENEVSYTITTTWPYYTEHHHWHYPATPYKYDWSTYIVNTDNHIYSVRDQTASSSTMSNCSATYTPNANYTQTCDSYTVPAAGSIDAHMDSQHLGAGFGKEASHKVHEVSFEKASAVPDVIYEIYYDSKQGLVARGILNQPQVCRKPEGPRAFPKNDRGCTPPPGWDK